MRRKKVNAKYQVLVYMENSWNLADVDAVAEACRGKLRGHLCHTIDNSERGKVTGRSYRRFFLTNRRDLPAFCRIIQTFNGVVSVEKGPGPW